MEQEFRHEQEMMRREMYNKDARIDAQEKKIAALDTANSHLIRTIASLNPRPGEIKPDLTGDLHNDSCNASDTSDYKSSSCWVMPSTLPPTLVVLHFPVKPSNKRLYILYSKVMLL